MYTENYNLYVTAPTDDPYFQEWRNALCGNDSTSNMQKIDQALASQKSKSVELVLFADLWNADKTQVLSVEGLAENQKGSISVSGIASAEQREAARNAVLSPTAQTNGSLTITADGELPVVDIPVALIILG